MLAGSWLSGAVVQHYTLGSAAQPAHDWRAIWLISMSCSAVVFVPFLFIFHEQSERRTFAPDAVEPGDLE